MECTADKAARSLTWKKPLQGPEVAGAPKPLRLAHFIFPLGWHVGFVNSSEKQTFSGADHAKSNCMLQPNGYGSWMSLAYSTVLPPT